MSEFESGYGAPGSDGRGPEPRNGDGQGSQGAVDGVRTVVRNRVQEMEEKARETTQSLRSSAERKATDTTSRVGSGVSKLARALRAAGDELRTEGEDRLARLTEETAGQIERVGSYLEGGNPRDMMTDLERAARNNPALFVGGTFALGLLAGRFLRAGEPAPEPGTPGYGSFATGDGSRDFARGPDWSGDTTGSGSTLERTFDRSPTEAPESAGEPVDTGLAYGRGTGLERGTSLHTDEPAHGSTGPGESTARSALSGHETMGPGIRTGSSGAASLDAGSGGPRQTETDARPDRRRDDEEGL